MIVSSVVIKEELLLVFFFTAQCTTTRILTASRAKKNLLRDRYLICILKGDAFEKGRKTL